MLELPENAAQSPRKPINDIWLVLMLLFEHGENIEKFNTVVQVGAGVVR